MKEKNMKLIEGYLGLDKKLLNFYITLSKNSEVPKELRKMWDNLAGDEAKHIKYFKYLIDKNYSVEFKEKDLESLIDTLIEATVIVEQDINNVKDGILSPKDAFKETVNVELKALSSPIQELFYTHDIIISDSIFNPGENYDKHLQRIVDRVEIFFAEDSIEHTLINSFQWMRKNQANVIKDAKADKLTGLKNRNHFFESAKFLLQIAKREKSPLGIVMIDIDKFKEINDTYGHLNGDRILKNVGKKIRSQVRNSDVAGRYGGDEFAIALYDQTEDKVKAMLERLKNEIRSSEIWMPDKEKKVVPEISAGYTVYNSYDKSPSLKDLIDQADRNMYLNKKK